MSEEQRHDRRQRSVWFAWWYFAISAGFLLLAVYYYLHGGRPLLIVLRCVIAGSFAVLGYLQWQASRRGKPRHKS